MIPCDPFMHLTKVSHNETTLLNNKRPQCVLGNVVWPEQWILIQRNYCLPNIWQLLSKSNTSFPTQMLYYILSSPPFFFFIGENSDFFCGKKSPIFCLYKKIQFAFPVTSEGLTAHLQSLSLPRTISISPVTRLRITWTWCLKGFIFVEQSTTNR